MLPRFDNSYAKLPERFYTRLLPTPVRDPSLIRVNVPLATQLRFEPEWLTGEEGVQFAVGNQLMDGSDPIATAYAGHQFGGFNPGLGDGRAILLGEVLDVDGARFDIQLKGSGRTPYSRMGDGRSPLGPVLREYIVSEAMAALGIETTRSLAACRTGETVVREGPLPGGILVRVARSHIRIGTFEYFAARNDIQAVELLTRHVMDRHYPELDPDDPMALLEAVANRQAELVAQWMLVGFIHGVMNTDNMLLSGETIDYGPCAFMNEYDPATVFSSIDRGGRYAYGNQPAIAQWNLARFAEALLLIDGGREVERARTVLDAFPETFRQAYRTGLAPKLGLERLRDDDWSMVEDLLELMAQTRADYTLTFSRLTELACGTPADGSEPIYNLDVGFEPWVGAWRERLVEEADDAVVARMRGSNPYFIPRNHLVERAIEAAVQETNDAPFHELMEVLARPFEFDPARREFALPPSDEDQVHVTYCGT